MLSDFAKPAQALRGVEYGLRTKVAGWRAIGSGATRS
jgi:hypothetical protein